MSNLPVKRKDITYIRGLDTEGLFDEIEDYKSGEALFKMLKLGLSVIEIETRVFLKATTIEERIVNYLIENGKEDEFEILYNCRGFPKMDTIKKYIALGADDTEFLKYNKSCEKRFKTAKLWYKNIPFISSLIEQAKEKRHVSGEKIQLRTSRKWHVCYHPIKLG